MLSSMFVTAIVLLGIAVVKVYDLVVAMTGGGPGISTEVPAKFVIDYLFNRQNIALATAAATRHVRRRPRGARPLALQPVFPRQEGRDGMTSADASGPSPRPEAEAPDGRPHRHLRLPGRLGAVLPAALLRHDRHLAEDDAGDPAGRHLRMADSPDDRAVDHGVDEGLHRRQLRGHPCRPPELLQDHDPERHRLDRARRDQRLRAVLLAPEGRQRRLRGAAARRLHPLPGVPLSAGAHAFRGGALQQAARASSSSTRSSACR